MNCFGANQNYALSLDPVCHILPLYTVPSGLLIFISHLRYQMHHRRVAQRHGETRGYNHRLETSA